MCVVIITQHNWSYIYDNKSYFSSPLFAQFQVMKMSDLYLRYISSVGEHKNGQEISGM